MMPRRPLRAPRYAVHVALQYRQRGDLRWLYGRTENVSSSGLLFAADITDPTLDLNAPIEMSFVMPAEIVGAARTRVVCFGRVVRNVRPRMPHVRPAFAVTIAEYRLVRGDGAEFEEVRDTV